MRFQLLFTATFLATLLGGTPLCTASNPKPSPTASQKPDRILRLEAVVKDGTKYWLPSELTAKKGERIHLRLENKIPGPNSIHGFRLRAFHIEELVDSRGKEIDFTADQPGVFPFECHLHPTHVGGHLTVKE
jgi:plastocyanin